MKIPKIKLSEKYAKGSYSDRYNTALNMTESLFKRIYPLYKNRDAVPVRELERTIKSFMPEPIFFSVKKNKPDEDYTGCLKTFFSDFKICKYQIELLAKQNNMTVENIPTLLHENMHLFDYLLNPKYRRTQEKIREKNILEKTTNLYNKNYYNNRGFSYNNSNVILLFKTFFATLRTLKGENTKNKILILNSVKESIEVELRGYKATKKYANVLRKKGRQYYQSDVSCFYEEFMFEEKLKMIKMMLRLLIKKERLINSITRTHGVR